MDFGSPSEGRETEVLECKLLEMWLNFTVNLNMYRYETATIMDMGSNKMRNLV